MVNLAAAGTIPNTADKFRVTAAIAGNILLPVFTGYPSIISFSCEANCAFAGTGGATIKGGGFTITGATPAAPVVVNFVQDTSTGAPANRWLRWC